MLHRFRVFCASPGDVSDARSAVQSVVEQLDGVWRDRGVTVEFDGWEDSGPAAGRPQDEINSRVDVCDVFIGLLNGRWGFPTGAYQSGFEEEYERALRRHEDRGSPELAVLFTDQAARDPQLPLVEIFRTRIEKTQEVYYRRFTDLDDLRHLVHRRLEQLLTERFFVAPAEQRSAPVDWAAVLSAGPFGQVLDGQARHDEATAAAEHDPSRAADLLESLATDLSARDLPLAAEQVTLEAVDLRRRAGDVMAANALLLAVLRPRATRGSVLARLDARRLRELLCPEEYWIADAWEALIDWPERSQEGVGALRASLAAADHALVSNGDRHVWRERMGEILLWGGHHDDALAACDDLPGLDGDSSDAVVRLRCLAAEALSLSGRYTEAADAWDELLVWTDAYGGGRPALAGVVVARRAVSLVRQERLAGAQRNFRAAAQYWTTVEGAQGEVAEQHFSAQSAASLVGDLTRTFDRWRAQAVSLRSSRRTPEAVADRLIRDGLAARVEGKAFDALNRLTLAIHEHRRAGHLRGELHATSLLAELLEHAGEHAAALAASVQCGKVRDAIRLAASVDPEVLLDALDLVGPSWARRASMSALGVAGRRLPAEQVTSVAQAVLAAARERGTSMAERDRQVAGVEAAASLVHEWPVDNRKDVVALLSEAAASGDLLIAEPAVLALQLRTNSGQGDHVGELVDVMLNSRAAARVSAMWVAGHLDGRPAVVDRLHQASAVGNLDALEALCAAENVELNAEAGAAVEEQLRQWLSRPLGRTPEGHIIGFLRLEPWGVLARRAPSEGTRVQVAEALVAFALDDDEPQANRASAANAVHNLVPGLQTEEARRYAEELRPLAEGCFGASAFDVPREVAEHLFNRFRMGDEAAGDRLQAAALTACAKLLQAADAGDTTWLAEAVGDALLHDEPRVVAGAWEAVGRAQALQLPGGLEAHLAHPAHEVRVAVLDCWRARRDDAPPVRVLRRLTRDDRFDVRLRLLALLRDGNRHPATRAAMAADDPDAYIRAAGAAPLRAEEATPAE
jgi:tetratricopeptide (TPR) repeat protein